MLFILGATLYSYGQDKTLEHVSVENNRSKMNAKTILIDFDIILNGVEIPANEQLTLTPKLASAETDESLTLPPVLVNGKKRDKLYKRSLRLTGNRAVEKPYSVGVTPKRQQRATVRYTKEIPFDQSNQWMKESRLLLMKDLCGCGGGERDYEETVIASRIGFDLGKFDYAYRPSPHFTDPPRESPKKRNENGQAYLIFKTAKWDVLPDLYDNRKELDKIEQSLHFVKGEPTAVITHIYIKAYASPEGTYESNLTLSKRRAEALRSYIQTRYRVSGDMLSSTGEGEDWETLYKMVEDDRRMPYQDEALRIMQSVGIFDGREKRLMDLDDGRPYRYMKEYMFPYLRRSDYQIEYEVPEFTVEKGKEMLKTRPQMLSLKEMYVIANTYRKGSDEFIELFNIAYKVFPYDKYANLNAAAAMIMTGDYEGASELLGKYENEPECWNNLGIVYASRLQFDDAERMLRKAYERGDAEAEYNLLALKELKKAYEKYQGQK
jgi:outer membrane protein OmpA-like peptidoglycan-associated protein